MKGFTVRSVEHADYGALVSYSLEPEAIVYGYLIYPTSRSEEVKPDEFEEEAYARETVVVTVTDSSINVQANVYTWAGAEDALEPLSSPWSFEELERERLDDWLEFLWDGK